MQEFTSHTGVAALLMRDNVDTDAIIPSREMKTVSKTGLGVGLFASWRYSDEKTRTPEPDFVLNKPEFQNASILVSGANFGCGSSREHAVWALKDFGIRCVIAQSFGNIFARNCIRNGILPLALPKQELLKLATTLEATPSKHELQIDLVNKQVLFADQLKLSFDINKADRYILINSMDQIALTKELDNLIEDFKVKDLEARPWAAVKK